MGKVDEAGDLSGGGDAEGQKGGVEDREVEAGRGEASVGAKRSGEGADLGEEQLVGG